MAETDLVRLSLQASQTSSLATLVQRRQAEKRTFLLLDCSGSMSDPCGEGLRKIDQLRTVVAGLHVACPLVGFGLDGAEEVRFIERIPDPFGSTPLDKAIAFAKDHQAQHLIVVSDGQPNSPEAALQAAGAFQGPIDVFYVGEPGGPGEAFLARLAAHSGGQAQTTSLKTPDLLTTGIRALLQAGTKV